MKAAVSEGLCRAQTSCIEVACADCSKKFCQAHSICIALLGPAFQVVKQDKVSRELRECGDLLRVKRQNLSQVIRTAI